MHLLHLKRPLKLSGLAMVASKLLHICSLQTVDLLACFESGDDSTCSSLRSALLLHVRPFVAELQLFERVSVAQIGSTLDGLRLFEATKGEDVE